MQIKNITEYQDTWIWDGRKLDILDFIWRLVSRLGRICWIEAIAMNVMVGVFMWKIANISVVDIKRIGIYVGEK